jgi:hypothetical protein
MKLSICLLAILLLSSFANAAGNVGEVRLCIAKALEAHQMIQYGTLGNYMPKDGMNTAGEF